MNTKLDKKEVTENLIQILEDSYDKSDLKILDAFLSKIDIQTPDNDKISFISEEFETMAGIKGMSLEAIWEALKKIMKPITIYSGKNKNEWTKFVLFISSECEWNETLKQPVITMQYSDVVKEYLFDAETISYIKQHLEDIIK
jgi:hypothetical protein